MPKFVKEIARPGRYQANKPGSSDRVTVDVTPSRIRQWVDTFGKMKAAGIKIPAPFRHDTTIIGLTAEQAEAIKTREKSSGSLLNAGFWDDVFEDAKTGNLCGVLDVPDAETAKKVGNSIKECSLLSLPEFVDGVGNKWTDPILHIALVTNPVIPGQENFQSLPSTVPGTAVAMSLFVEEIVDTTTDPAIPVTSPAATAAQPSVTTAASNPAALSLPTDPANPEPNPDKDKKGFEDAVAILKSLGIDIPPDTTPENLCQQIVTNGNKAISDKEKATRTQVSQDVTIVSPVGGSAMALTEFAADSPLGKLVKNTKIKDLGTRIADGIKRGIYSKEYADTVLMPKVAACQMSLAVDEEGNLAPTSLDTILDALEQLPANSVLTGSDPAKLKNPGSQFSVEEPPKNSANFTDADVERTMQTVYKNCGIPLETSAAR